MLAQTEGLHLTHPDEAIREKTSQYLCDLVDFCADLGGNISGGLAIRWRMAVFYFIVWLQKFLPLCPRLTLMPKKSAAPAVEPLQPAA